MPQTLWCVFRIAVEQVTADRDRPSVGQSVEDFIGLGRVVDGTRWRCVDIHEHASTTGIYQFVSSDFWNATLTAALNCTVNRALERTSGEPS